MSIEETLKKVDNDIALGCLGKARERIHGLLSTYPDNLDLRRKLGEIYWQLQYPEKAGLYWYLEDCDLPNMVAAKKKFESSCGGDPICILQKLKFFGDIEEIRDTYAGRILLNLKQQAKSKYGYNHEFVRPRRGREQFKATSTDKFIPYGCGLALLTAIGFMIIGIISVLIVLRDWILG